jgi:hypothetical protein
MALTPREHQEAKSYWDMGELLKDLCNVGYLGSDIVCPFHPDTSPSASFFEEDNHLYCFYCKQVYSPADLLMEKGGYTENEIRDELPDHISPKQQSKPLSEGDYYLFEKVEEVWDNDRSRALNGFYEYLRNR